MKKIKSLLVVFGMIISSQSFSQIQIHERPKEIVICDMKVMGIWVAKTYYSISDADTLYTLQYRNSEYTHIVDIQQVTCVGKGTFDQLHHLLKSVFTDEHRDDKDYKISFTLGKDMCMISNFRQMGAPYAYLGVSGKGYTLFNEKRLDKLFAK